METAIVHWGNQEFLGYCNRGFIPIMENQMDNQMEKNMENEMDPGIILGVWQFPKTAI